MKKVVFAMLFLLLLTGSFLVGIWYSQREALKTNRSDPSSPVVAAPKKTDTVTGTDTARDTDASSMPPGTVKITPQKRQMIGVQVGTVETASATYTLRTLGRVAPDENRVHRLLAATEGWLWEVYGSTTGSLVRKDQLMATYYSNEFFGRQQQFFFALDYRERLKQQPAGQKPDGRTSATETPTQPPGRNITSDYRLTRDQAELARQELINLGVGEYQMEEIARTRQYATYIEIRSPAAGLVLSRNVSPRQKFSQGAEFFKVADLGRVWIVADVFDGEATYIRPGMSAGLSLPDQGKIFRARVSEAPPQVDTTTRTLKVRLEADNVGYALRPDMFVDVEFLVSLPRAITVPADAVLDSGLRKTVFIDLGEGFLEPRTVETGRRFGNRVEITKGLKNGERIVVAGNFLIDSESRLELAAAGMAGVLSKDPVCGADVSMKKAEKAGRTVSFGGKIYYFESDECKVQFDKNPDRYASKP